MGRVTIFSGSFARRRHVSLVKIIQSCLLQNSELILGLLLFGTVCQCMGRVTIFSGSFAYRCLLSEDNTITPIADAYFLSEAAQCQKYTLSDLVDHVDPKHTAAQQVVTIGAFCYPMVGHLREKDTPYNPYKRSLYPWQGPEDIGRYPWHMPGIQQPRISADILGICHGYLPISRAYATDICWCSSQNSLGTSPQRQGI